MSKLFTFSLKLSLTSSVRDSFCFCTPKTEIKFYKKLMRVNLVQAYLQILKYFEVELRNRREKND